MSEKKAARAVLVRLSETDGSLSVKLDDVEQTAGREWSQRGSITFKEIDAETFDRMQFKDAELADFGFYILARLHAFKAAGRAP